MRYCTSLMKWIISIDKTGYNTEMDYNTELDYDTKRDYNTKLDYNTEMDYNLSESCTWKVESSLRNLTSVIQ